MVLTYDRPVIYQSNMFNTRGDFEHNISIKLQHESGDYFTKDPSFSVYSQVPAMEEFKFKQKSVLDDPESPQLISWTRTHPQHWTRKEVLDWIYFVVEQEHLDGSKLQGEAYNNFIGKDLCEMDRRQFLEADPYYGSKMYETFRSLINGVSFEAPKTAADIGSLDTFNTSNNIEYIGLNRNIDRGVTGKILHGGNGGGDSDNSDRHSDLLVYHSDNDIKVSLLGLGIYSISPEIELPSTRSSHSILPRKLKQGELFTQPLVPLSPSHLPEFSSLSSSQQSSSMHSYTKKRTSLSSVYSSASSHSITSSRKMSSLPRSHTSSTTAMSSPRLSTTSSFSLSVSLSLPQTLQSSSTLSSPCRIDKIDHGYLSDDSCSSNMPPYHPPSLTNMSFSGDMDINHSTMRVPGLLSDECTAHKRKDKKNRNNATKNGNHLWEFVRDLLRDPQTNPKLLKWEDKDHGVFRFVQSEKVAQLWGEKKNNPLMTYEKLSRAMRFCRTAGYFDTVPKTGKFPKKLCFRFGEKAHGWKD